MAKNVPIDFRFGAIDKLSAPIEKINAKMRLLGDQADYAKKRMSGLVDAGKSLQGIGTAMTVGITAPVAAAAALSVKQFGDFENSMLGVKTLLDQGSFGAKGLEAGFKDMQKSALKAVSEIPVELEHTTKALFDSVSAGVEAGKAVDFVRVSAKLAVAGLTEVSVATDGMTSALNAYKLSADQAEVVASKFFTAQKFGKTTIAQLSEGFGMVGAIGASTGVSLNELLAATSAATLGGIKTNSAYTGLKAVLAGVIKPTSEATEEAERLGIAFDGNALKQKGLKGLLDSITKSQNFNGDSLTKLFGSVEALNIAMALTGKQAGDFDNILKNLGNETKTVATFQQAYADQSVSMNNKMQLFKNKLQALSITIGEKLAPSLIKLTDIAEKVFGFFERNPAITNMTLAFAGLLATVGPILLFFGTILTMIPQAVAGFALFTAGVAKVIGIFSILGTVIAYVKTGFAVIGAVIAAVTSPVWGTVAAVAALIAGLVLLWKKWDSIKEIGGKIVNWTKGLFGSDTNVNVNKTIKTAPIPTPKDIVTQQTVNMVNNNSGKKETEVKVSFENMPKGTKVKTEKSEAPLALNLGYSMGQ